ncbi:putative Mg2+ transporter protein, CorA-like/Zinc transport protein ZntB [Helianthus annuus]|uniref:Mg2+ transporter protein, CorA-like/Zinc transport protein ZntB n=1 Tax=Helianthus annuus TaxID=4232 RepID=A0A251SED1_HELAN|nr:putative Mg2+ transporter protein, CorA-like/Zinc transport protein ZntB [Helianthus annuus]KAJ0463016.1 putative Mg2+ transporter protein, CorA-like/Zinc transport protein ZntB [Helianthus annuus]KAJ0484259.1 putative Mg2+ transporter protein, CorA-like/Zinc transport protein ZntB [Helianthus annuus]KAJ0484379.1 putative Mg2+ transporter protein, CorA-like/Zinc transport protein ZntB [Helianthus annuus]KAJ0654931.1 putative Mg2+ transporter protein, CorA-like/Zinc transport protein ZntB [He
MKTSSLEELIGRLRRLKENVGFISNRVTAVQAGLDSWQAEQINRKLYCLSFLSIIFLPLSIITGEGEESLKMVGGTLIKLLGELLLLFDSS